MAVKTVGLKKRKKKGPPSIAKKPPKYWTGKPVGPGRPKKPPVGVKPGPGKPEKPSPKKPKKPPVYKPKPPGKKPPQPKKPPKKYPEIGIPGLKPGKPGKPNYGGYVSKHKDLADAYKKHKAKGGTGTAAEWGKKHYDKHGKKEKRKLS